MAHSSLVSIILNSKQKDDVTAWPSICGPMLNYIKSKLGLHINEDLDMNFATKLGLVDKSPAAAARAHDKMTAANVKGGIKAKVGSGRASVASV